MVKEIKEHFRRVKRVLIVVLALNWLVALAKIIFGLISRSASMTADGFHSLSDGASNIIGLIGIKLSAEPQDEDHPYGHRKFETLFSMVIAAMLFVLAFHLIEEGIKRIIHPVVPNITLTSFVVMISTLVINFLVMRYEFRKGKELASDILVADAMHTRADIFTSISVIATLIAIKSGYPIFDAIVTLLISLFIGYAGYEIIKEGSGVLCDATVIDVKKIEAIVLSVKGVKSCHKVRTRGRPDAIFVDLHVQLSPDVHLDKAHDISDLIEDTIHKQIPEVTEVLVHLEPKGK